MKRIITAAIAVAALAAPAVADASPLTGSSVVHHGFVELAQGLHKSLVAAAPARASGIGAVGDKVGAVAHTAAYTITSLTQIQPSVVSQLQSTDLSKIEFVVSSAYNIPWGTTQEIWAICPTGYTVRAGGVNQSDLVTTTFEGETTHNTSNLNPSTWDVLIRNTNSVIGQGQMWAECEEAQNSYTAGGTL